MKSMHSKQVAIDNVSTIIQCPAVPPDQQVHLSTRGPVSHSTLTHHVHEQANCSATLRTRTLTGQSVNDPRQSVCRLHSHANKHSNIASVATSLSKKPFRRTSRAVVVIHGSPVAASRCSPESANSTHYRPAATLLSQIAVFVCQKSMLSSRGREGGRLGGRVREGGREG